MPPHGEIIMNHDPIVSPHPSSTSGGNKDAKKKKKTKHRSKSRDDKQPRNNNNNSHNDKSNKEKSKKKEKRSNRVVVQRKSSQGSSTSNNSSDDNNNNAPQGGCSSEKGGGVTVSQFMQQQQTLQNEASSRKNHMTMRQRMMQQQYGIMMGNPNNDQQQEEEEGERTHYFDDDDSDYEDEGGGERGGGAMVPRNNNGRTSSAVSAAVAPPKSQQVVDTIPADHPTSSTIQTHRTCTLCQRTLPRSQFSERDRFTINLSLAPGATCRTCAMTISAVRLKSIPDTEQLLLEYAQRGIERGMLAISSGGHAHPNNNNPEVAGYLQSENDLMQRSQQALVLRQNSTGSGVTGKELTLYGGAVDGNTSRASGSVANTNGQYIMGMQHAPTITRDINSTFSGTPYSHSDADRSPNIADCKYIDAMLRMPCYLNLNALGIFTSAADVSVSMACLEAIRLYGTLDEGYFVPHDCDGRRIILPSMKNNEESNSSKEKGGGGGGKRVGDKRCNSDEDTAGVSSNVNPKSVVCLVLNEGPTPRTAILASQHYGWTTIAIDPTLSEEWNGYHDDIPNFTGYSGTINDFMGNSGEYTESMIEFCKQSVQHLVIVGISQPNNDKDVLRLKGSGHMNEIRSRYDDVPTTLVSLSPVRKATLAPTPQRIRSGQCGSKLEKDVGYEPNCSYIDEGVFSICRQVEVWNFHNAEDDDDDDDSDGSYSDEDDGEYYEHDERYNRQESTESDYVNRKRSGRGGATSRRGEVDQIEQQQQEQESVKKDKKKRSTSRKQKDAGGGNKRNDWLEDRVAEFKQTREQEQARMFNDDDTLSTKGTLDRLPSSDRVIDKMPSRDDSGHGISSAMPEEKRHSSEHHADPDDYQQPPQQEDEQRKQLEDRGQGNEDHANNRNDNNSNNNDETKAWSPPDEEAVSQVWEKAMAKHGEQESFCNQFEQYYNKGDSSGSGGSHNGGNHGSNDQKQDDKDHNGQGDENDPNDPSHGLPPGWEALYDESSGDYYYNNWETGEVTWDHPLGEDADADAGPGNNQEGGNDEQVPMNPLKQGGVEDRHGQRNDDSSGNSKSIASNDDKPVAAASFTAQVKKTAKSDEGAPPLAMYNKSFNYSHEDSENEDSSHYVFDDQSSASSGIAALSRWNNPQQQKLSSSPPSHLEKTLEQPNATEEDDDMIAWSDDEGDNSRIIQRSGSGASMRQQPWHKKESADDFLYD